FIDCPLFRPELRVGAVCALSYGRPWTPHWHPQLPCQAEQRRPSTSRACARAAFSSMTRERADALIVLSDAMFLGRRKQIAELAAVNRLPAIFWTGEYASYGPDGLELARRAAGYVHRILKGAKAGDLPVEQPTKFALTINQTTAKALGLA